MQIKKTSFLVTIFLFAVSLLLINGCDKNQERSHHDSIRRENVSDNVVPSMDKSLIVYYFHGTFRCHTCLKIERLTKDVVTNRFPDELESGELKLKIINSDEPENKHFENLFQLKNQSVILAVYQNKKLEKWKNLTEIWKLYDNEELFFNYIHEEIMLMLGEI